MAVTVTFKSEVDLKNLFISFEKVDFRDYGITENQAHIYTLKTIYSFPSGMETKLINEYSPETVNCGNWACRTYPANQKSELLFTHKDFNVKWVLVDQTSGKIVGEQKESLSIKIIKSGLPGGILEFENGIYKGYFERKSNQKPLIFIIDSSSNLNQITLKFQKDVSLQRFMNMSFELVKSDNGNKIKKIIFDEKKLQESSYNLQGAMLDIDYHRYGFYFGVGSPGNVSPSYKEILESVSNK